jgi:hypothetical protein
MSYFLFLFSNYQELSCPLIKLTKSKTGNISTATLLFINPKILEYSDLIPLDTLSLSWMNEKKETILTSSIVKIIYKHNKAYAIKVLFIFLEIKELFYFLDFIMIYMRYSKNISK